MNKIKCTKCRVSTRYSGILPKRTTCKSCGADLPIGLSMQGKQGKQRNGQKYIIRSMTWTEEDWNDFEVLCSIWNTKKSSLNRSVYRVLLSQNRDIINKYKESKS